jgi:hypothetical protein
MSDGNRNGGYEATDARPWPLAAAGLGLLVLLGVGLVAATLLDDLFARETAPVRTERHPMAGFREPPAGPVLQADPARELVRHEAWENEALLTYDWIDVEAGIVRIPIHRAVQLVLEEGLPVRDGAEEDR